MSTTLDKLKALNDKLDAKLSANIKDDSGQKTAPVPSKKTAQKSRKKPEKTSEEEKPSAEALSDQLMRHMQIDLATEKIRAENLMRIVELYVKLGIYEKAPEIENLFIYKAMNISGIGLKEEDFGQIREGKYVQVIAITYEPDKTGKKKAKNVSLGYFGKAETLEENYKNEIIEFVLRWRYEKAFQNLEHYRELLERVGPNDRLF
jgi:hypothetical protein